MSDLEVPIHIIYASTSGNVEFVCELVAGLWRQKGAEVFLHRSEQTPIESINTNSRFLFATSTWDNGSINPFFDRLLREMKTTDFSGKVSSFIGLGDRRYEKHYFCEGIKILQQQWEKNSGKSVGVILTIGREPYEDAIKEMVTTWAHTTYPLYQETQGSNTNEQ